MIVRGVGSFPGYGPAVVSCYPYLQPYRVVEEYGFVRWFAYRRPAGSRQVLNMTQTTAGTNQRKHERRVDNVDGPGQGEMGRQGDRRQGDWRDSNLEEKTVQNRQYIFRESEPGEIAFVIQSGTVEITKHAGGNEVVLGTLGQGEMFGETALIDNAPRMASARASGGPVTVMVLPRSLFESKLATVDPFVQKLLKILVANVRSTSQKVR